MYAALSMLGESDLVHQRITVEAKLLVWPSEDDEYARKCIVDHALRSGEKFWRDWLQKGVRFHLVSMHLSCEDGTSQNLTRSLTGVWTTAYTVSVPKGA